jgi:protoporphyrinogen oxidase
VGAVSEVHARDARFVVIGAGPAGLTAAYELVKLGLRPVVLEKERLVGGLARTEKYKGFHFDMGGHRFFTKSEEVKKMWHEVLGDQLLRRPRLSRIFYDGKFFNYPLKPVNALLGLGLCQSVLIVLSYLRWQLFPHRREDTFEQWVTNRFGRRLFEIFFKTYTEKVWGISCSELKAEWAAQRIKDLSLKTALLSMFLKPKTAITTLIEEFDYPRLGPGMMWEAVRDAVEQRGGAVRLGAGVTRIRRTGTRIDGVVVRSAGGEELVEGTDFVSSMPVTELVEKLDPPAPAPVREAAKRLHYRDFLTVCLIVNRTDLFPDNWIYVHSSAVKVGRIQNFKNWSPEMVPDPGKSSLGLEYFCTEGDELWTMTDRDLVELGKAEVERIGLARADEIEDGCVVRVPKSYPVYDLGYSEHLAVVRQFVDGLDNVQTIGRNGLHRYNNQDHAMLTGMLAVRNATLGERNDLWSVNVDQEYHEEIRQAEAPAAASAEEAVSEVFTRIDGVALGLAAGITSGLLLLLATIALGVKGGGGGLNLGLLSQYFPGYRVTLGGSILGLVYGFAAGFIAGWVFAYVRNAAAFVSMVVIYRRAELERLRRILEYL